MEHTLSDKVIVITGASSGIGESTARLLAAKGAKVVLAARRKDKLDAIVASIPGGNALAVATDVTDREKVARLVSETIARFGRLDVMINNAGLMAIAPLSQTRVEEWDRMIDINIKGLLYGVAAALPVFEQQGSGHFVNIASVAGLKVFSPGGTVYSGTKFAVRAISEGLRHEVARKDIRVTTIEPGAVDSELKYGSGDDASRNFVLDFYKQAISADAVARAIAFALEQPADVGINEIVLRPTAQEF